jgi:ribosome-associated protein
MDGSDQSGLRINGSVVIPLTELVVRATKSSGPGGQHVNTSSTKVEVVWNVRTSSALTDAQRFRALTMLATRVDGEGNIRVVASDTRSQRQNRSLAEERLAEMVRRSLVVPKVRRRTKPTRSSVENRLIEKKRQAGKKRDRRSPGDD